jgi:signal transduction histidine kinase
MRQSQLLDEAGAKPWPRQSMTWQFALWTFIGLLSASQYYSFYRFENERFPLWRLMMWQMPSWYLWGLLTPLVLLLGRRFHIERTRWIAPLAIHLLIAVQIAFSHLSISAFFRWAFFPTASSYGQVYFVNLWFVTFAGSFHIALLIYFAILGVGYLFEFYRKYRERELAASVLEKQLAQAQLQALKMQLHPHFLFNTLHTISVLVRKKENQTAVRMISGLSDLLRYVLQQNEAQEILLRQELDFIEQYLEIERLRFQDRMKVQINVEAETLDAKVPNLILQPLAENAIRHGVAARADAGLVEIRSWRDNDTLWLEVRDDGPGISNDLQITNGNGLGLKNTQARLKQIYGELYCFELQNAESAGAVAKLGIPFNII